MDRSGKILWEARTGGNPPWHAARLDNGNTLVTLTQARRVVEYDPTGKTIVWSTQVPLSNPYIAQRLASGNTLVADQTGVHEIDASGKVERWTPRHLSEIYHIFRTNLALADSTDVECPKHDAYFGQIGQNWPKLNEHLACRTPISVSALTCR